MYDTYMYLNDTETDKQRKKRVFGDSWTAV